MLNSGNNESLDIKTQKNIINIFHNSIIAWIILFISLTLTLVAYFVSQSFVQQRALDRFEFRAIEIEQAIKDRLLVYEQALWGGVALLYSSNNVSRNEWAQYVETLNISKNWPGIQGIGYSIPILSKNKENHIATIRSEGFPNYTIRPEGKRDTYTSIIYLEPFDWRNIRAFGYDMWSNDMRRKAMIRARDDGVAATSGIITLVQETNVNTQKGFLTYVPVYSSKKNQQR